MASGAGAPNLLEYDDYDLISEHDDLQQFMNNSAITIVQNMAFNASLWSGLIKRNVVKAAAMNQIKLKGTNEEMGSELLAHIKTAGHLQGLFMALVKDGQGYIVKNLGLEPADFKEGATHWAGPRTQVGPGNLAGQGKQNVGLQQARVRLLDPTLEPTIIPKLRVGVMMLSHMGKHLDIDERQQLEHPGQTGAQKANLMLQIIRSKGSQAQLAFIEALTLTQQSGVLEVLGL